MVVEDSSSSRSSITDGQNVSNPNPSPNLVSKISNDQDLEEGEISDSSSSLNLQKEVAIKHPLENSWTFWFDSPSAKKNQVSWGSSNRPIYTFSTIEDFWGLYNNILCPSKLSHGADLYCFKDKIVPKWEDPICAAGGNWTMNFQKGKSDNLWLFTLLAMIGEQFDHADEICGAVVNVRARQQEKISIWTKNALNEAAQVSIGKQWKEFLDSSENIGFIFHEDSTKFDKGAKSKYTA